MSTPTQRRGRLRCATTVITVVAGVLLLSTSAPASADTRPPVNRKPIDQYVAKYDHPMGSQIRRVEGVAPELRMGGIFAAAAVPGIDVSGHQGTVDWSSQWSQGNKFVYVKATEATDYINPYFSQQYNGSYDVGMIRGAYHFAVPNKSSGAAQANHFLAHGGGWSGDGKTLPGALDMEYNPYDGGGCYGLSKNNMTAWISDFNNTYHSQTNKWPTLYTSTSWWSNCVDGDFSATNPLWVARYASSVGSLPAKWSVYTIWQHNTSPIDKDTFNGAYDSLVALATNQD